MPAPADAIGAALVAPLAALGVDLDGIEVERAGRRHVVRVVVDRDGGVDLDTVADVSRAVSEVLDSAELADVVPGPFVLEVSSPGVDRPLTQPQHWRRARGRLVEIELADATRLTGRIGGGDDESVTVAVEGADVDVRLADVRRAVVQVEFNRPVDAAGPAGDAGDSADESDESGR